MDRSVVKAKGREGGDVWRWAKRGGVPAIMSVIKHFNKKRINKENIFYVLLIIQIFLSNSVSFLPPSIFDCISIVILPIDKVYVRQHLKRPPAQNIFSTAYYLFMWHPILCNVVTFKKMGHASNYDQVTFQKKKVTNLVRATEIGVEVCVCVFVWVQSIV